MTRKCPYCGSADLFWHCRAGSGPATCNRCKALADTDTPNPIRTAIAEAMARRGVTQTELAKMAGTTQPKVSRFLAGKSVSVETVGRMVAALGLKVK